MNSKFVKFHSNINNMRKKVIEAKGGQQVQGLSKPVVSSASYSNKKRIKNQEKN